MSLILGKQHRAFAELTVFAARKAWNYSLIFHEIVYHSDDFTVKCNLHFSSHKSGKDSVKSRRIANSFHVCYTE